MVSATQQRNEWLGKAVDISKWFKDLQYTCEGKSSRPNLEGVLVATSPWVIPSTSAISSAKLAKTTLDARWEGVKLPPEYHDPLNKFNSSKSKEKGHHCCWNRRVEPCLTDADCDEGGEGCVANGTKTSHYREIRCSFRTADQVQFPYYNAFQPYVNEGGKVLHLENLCWAFGRRHKNVQLLGDGVEVAVSDPDNCKHRGPWKIQVNLKFLSFASL